MILRFKTTSADGSAHYIALNTDTAAYTLGAAASSVDFVLEEISNSAFSYILEELNFNAWNYTENIYMKPETCAGSDGEELPLW